MTELHTAQGLLWRLAVRDLMSCPQALSALSVQMTARTVRGFYQGHSQDGQRYNDLSSFSIGQVLQLRVGLHELCENLPVGAPIPATL
jgi:hypothetical protein